jgi:hypothetical protein
MYPIAILAILIAVSWLRVVRPGNLSIDGATIYNARIPLLARLRMHALVGTIVLLGSVAMQIWWGLPWWGSAIALISTAALVALPARYVLTTIGIRVGWTPFRRWTEFAGVSRAPGGARLQGAAGARDKRIWLSRSREDDEFLALLRRMIRNAYKGRNVLREFPPESPAEPPGSQAAATKVSRTVI